MRPIDRALAGAAAFALAWCSAVPAVGAPTRAAAAQEHEATADDFVGTWSSSYGTLELALNGTRLAGRYMPGSTISGTVVAGRFVYRYTDPNGSGEGWFEIRGGGAALAGAWRQNGSDRWVEWTAERMAAPEPGFAGLWETSFGRMRLRLDGGAVSGCYSLPSGSRVEGTVEGNRMEFTFAEPEAGGEGWFELTEDGHGFSGKWRSDGESELQTWTGTRVRPEAGRVWLVVLEAHWEESLAEPEYSFGDMLRAYFTMSSARHVGVRHRWFHDGADFHRFAADVAYLAEPVVLVISTHGTPEGIQVAGETIGPEAIAESLRDADNLELLHLSGCSMMNGPVPRRILERIEPARRFPVSGYSTVVAWDASALADFTFLTFVLIHRRSPEEAVRRSHVVAPFTGDRELEDSPFDALGLEVLTPEEL